MKKAYYILLYLVATVLTTACTHEEEDLFDSSSAARADAAVKADLEILTGATNGWLMEYFPEAQQSYGGYNVLVKFGTDGKVTVASELYNADNTATSLYSVTQSAGVVLSFDTYNDIFHLFSDPSDPTGLGGKGNGMEGDYDFLILEATAEKILLKGKKSGGLATLTPMPSNWKEYISEIQDASSTMSFKKFNLEMNGLSIPVTVSNRILTFTYEDENGDNKSVTASYIVNTAGYKFYEPIIIAGTTLSGFNFDATNSLFTATDDENVKLVPVIPPLNEQFVTGDWFIAYSQLGAFAQKYFAYCKQNYLDTTIGEELVYAFMGSALYGSFGFNFNSSGYTGLLGYAYELIGENQITLQFNMSGEGDGVWYHNNAGFNYLLVPFGYSTPRTFTLTTDNTAAPSYITLTEEANPDNSITLFADQVNYPFNN